MRAAAIALLAATATPQGRPDFSGKWILAPEPPSAAQGGARATTGGMGTGWGSDITVTQDAASLSVEYPQYGRYDMQPPAKLVYALNGSESRNTINAGRGPQELISKAAWEGNRLVITTTYRFAASKSNEPLTGQTTHALALESPGVLVVETTRGAVMGGEASVTRSVYKKG
jgi:hypothetical protein